MKSAAPNPDVHMDLDDDDYDENEDEDFNPDQAPGDDDGNVSSDDDEDDNETSTGKKKLAKRKSEGGGLEEADVELDSGDEATIKERKNKRKRRKKDADAQGAGAEDEDDESGGEGGFIRTRAQRQAERFENKQRRKAAAIGNVTVDVDQLWAELNQLPVGRPTLAPTTTTATDENGNMDVDASPSKPKPQPDDLIKIKKRITYAGEISEVTELVPRSSRAAQKYLAEHPEADPSHPQHKPDGDAEDGGEENSTGLHRPLKRPSIFEPNPAGLVRGVAPDKLRPPRAPSRLDVQRAAQAAEAARKAKAQKMSTVQKSALDWRGFVSEQAGLKEELDEYGKSKKGFLGREEFLDRTAGMREAAAREARLKG